MTGPQEKPTTLDRIEADLASLVYNAPWVSHEEMLALVAVARAAQEKNDARRGIIASCIAVKGKLDQPYPDDERWTPWTRFIEPALRRLDEAEKDLREALARLDTNERRM